MSKDNSEKRKVVLGVTGSIAAYKAVELARLFVSRGFQVRVIMTSAAREFVTPLTFEAVTNSKVSIDFWENNGSDGIEHIELADWADLVVVAPATADILAKMVSGYADSPLSATLLATKAEVLVAPAMNVNMWEHPATQENIRVLKERGVSFVNPEDGELACGWFGTGRLAEPKEIFAEARRCLSAHDYKGKKIVITAGPTREAIDPVRYISNRSSGKMGIALAEEAYRRGADVTLIHGPINADLPSGIKLVAVESAVEMYEAVMHHTYESEVRAGVVIMAAAVADYRPRVVAARKLKKKDGFLSSVELQTNPDILASVGAKKTENNPFLVGFAVETGEIDELIQQARTKLKEKNADLIIGNFAEEAFDLDTNRVWLVDSSGRQDEIATNFKSRIADMILDSILKRF